MSDNNNTLNIVDFFLNSSNEIIEANYINVIKTMIKFCAKFIGQGQFGYVSRPNYGDIVQVYVKDTYVSLKTVVKHFMRIGKFNVIHYNQSFYDDAAYYYKNDHPYYSKIKDIKVPDNLMIMYGDMHPIFELVVLSFLSKMWYDGNSPHMPFLVSPMACHQQNLVDAFLLDMNGLDDSIRIIGRGISTSIYDNPGFNTYLETFRNLIIYITYYDYVKNDTLYCDLPNGITVDVIDMMDSLVLSYLFTYEQVYKKYGIILNDQHSSNIMLQWLDPKHSYMGKQNIGNIKHIVYDINNKKYKIDTNGIILKIGDVGISVMKLRKDLIIVPDIVNDRMLYKSLYIERLPCYITLIIDIYSFLPPIILNETIISKIMNSEYFNNVNNVTGNDMDCPSASQIIEEYFSVYLLKDNIQENKNTTLFLKL